MTQHMTQHMAINDLMFRRLDRALQSAGYTHTLQDIIDEINAGTMQSFVFRDSWAVTCILDTPRRRVLEIFMAVGRLRDMPELEHRITEYARENDVTLMRTYGRFGFKATAKNLGWRSVQTVFTKELSYGR